LFLPSKKEGILFGVVELVPMELAKLVWAGVIEPEEVSPYLPEPVREPLLPLLLLDGWNPIGLDALSYYLLSIIEFLYGIV